MGYSVQVGAFAQYENASRLTDSLRSIYPDVYFFRHPSGLYKVRFGNFSTRALAESFAEKARRAGIIDDYYIVRPQDYAVVRSRNLPPSDLRRSLVETGYSFMGLPYQWGGESPEEGFDCSGLTMSVYQLNGLQIPRSSRQQYQAGKPVSRGKLQQGDLVFFRTGNSQRVSHVGLYLGNGEFLHAPGRGKTIRTDSLSSNYYAQRFVGARTYLW
jgi:cell wall-associated NlpC family hydrolase